MRDEVAAELRALYETVERLRAPGGCPWDRAQTHRTLRPYLLEETYEALEAIDAGRPGPLREELGDLLLQVFMHSVIAAEDPRDGFDAGDVAAVARTKMVHRHPHVFGDTVVGGAAEVVVNWERLKAREKGERLSVLDGVPHTLPALAHALGVQKRPARLGFDETADTAEAVDLLRAAVDALAVRPEVAAAPPARGADWVVDPAAENGAPPAAGDAPPPGGHAAGPPVAAAEVEDAVGEVLFAAVAAARRLRVNPEDALRRRALRFAERFRRLEARARDEGADLHDLPADAWAQRWADAAAAAEPAPGASA